MQLIAPRFNSFRVTQQYAFQCHGAFQQENTSLSPENFLIKPLFPSYVNFDSVECVPAVIEEIPTNHHYPFVTSTSNLNVNSESDSMPKTNSRNHVPCSSGGGKSSFLTAILLLYEDDFELNFLPNCYSAAV